MRVRTFFCGRVRVRCFLCGRDVIIPLLLQALKVQGKGVYQELPTSDPEGDEGSPGEGQQGPISLSQHLKSLVHKQVQEATQEADEEAEFKRRKKIIHQVVQKHGALQNVPGSKSKREKVVDTRVVS